MAEHHALADGRPFFRFGLMPTAYDWNDVFTNNLVTPDASGERIRIEGRVLDGDGAPIPDACWKSGRPTRRAATPIRRTRVRCRMRRSRASAARHRCAGRYAFDTIKPGAVPGPNGKMQAPHIVLAVFSRGVLKQMVTRIYFSDEAANAADPILALVPPSAARR